MQRRLSTSSRLAHLGFGIGGILILCMGVLSYVMTSRQREAERWVQHTYQVLETATEAKAGLLGVLATSRGYALTRSDDFEARYQQFVADFNDRNAAIAKLIQDNAAQQQRLQIITAQGRNVLDLAHATTVVPGNPVYIDSAYANLVEASRNAMDLYRQLTANFLAEEERLLEQRKRVSENEVLRLRMLLLFSALITMVILAISYAAVRRHIALLKEIEKGLEATVATRTADLSESNRNLEVFTHSVAHDLRAPLRAIEGFASLAIRRLGGGDQERATRHLDQVREQTDRMNRLITDLLAFAKSGQVVATQADVDLEPLVRSAWDELAGERAIHCSTARLQIQGPLPHVVGDPALLRQVLQNLLSNACKYSAERADALVTVAARVGVPPDTSVIPPRPRSGDEGARVVIISITDQGAGFDMAHYANLFAMFQRLHSEERFAGNGIGLAIVKRIVERHGGEIWAQGVPGQGATFSFSLPPSSVVVLKADRSSRYGTH